MDTLADQLTTAQQNTLMVIGLIAWGGLAVCFGLALAFTIRAANQRADQELDQEPVEQHERFDAAIAVSTRVDRWV